MKRINGYLQLVLLLLMAYMLGSCSSQKELASASADFSGLSDGAYLRGVLSKAPDFDEFSARMKLSLQYGDERISVGGSMKMVKDEVIQLSLVAIGIVEAAKIEITPKRILILDRISRRYIDMPYKDFKFFADSDIDFYTLQALFRNELFLPGVKRVQSADLVDFKVKKEEGKVTLTARENRKLTYAFLTALSSGLLQESQIHVQAKQQTKYRMRWEYADFSLFEKKQFPNRMNFSLEGTPKPLKASFAFSRLSADMEYEPVSIPNRYKEVEPGEILKYLLTL